MCRIAFKDAEKGFSNKGKRLEKSQALIEKITNAKKDGINNNNDKSNNLPYAFKLFIHKNALSKKKGVNENTVGDVSKRRRSKIYPNQVKATATKK